MDEGEKPVRTTLYEAHVEAGGHLVNFHGFELPIRYTTTLEEHASTRKAAGLFDVSHMGLFRFSGPRLLDWFDGVATQRVSTLDSGRCAYTHFLDHSGMIIDDMILALTDGSEMTLSGCGEGATKEDSGSRDEPWILGVPNASMIGTMWKWFSELLPNDDSVMIEDLSNDTAILALQGPKAPSIIQKVLGTDNAVGRFRAQAIRDNRLGIDGWIQGTGYTGEKGFEVFVGNDRARELWDALLAEGKEDGLVPVGLGARDTLRMEKGYLLSGQDFLWPPLIDSYDEHAAELGRDTAETHVLFGLDIDHDFIGRNRVVKSLEAQKSGSGARWLGVRYLEKGPFPRPGHAVFADDGGSEPRHVGTITSGGPSPSLGRVGIGLAYMTGVEVGDEVLVAPNPRKRVRAEVVRPPFI